MKLHTMLYKESLRDKRNYSKNTLYLENLSVFALPLSIINQTGYILY
jgi:hypothetical protein